MTAIVKMMQTAITLVQMEMMGWLSPAYSRTYLIRELPVTHAYSDPV